MSDVKSLMCECGMSQKGAARLLGVRLDSIKNWYYGRCNAPTGVVAQLEEYAACSKRIFNMIPHGKYYDFDCDEDKNSPK